MRKLSAGVGLAMLSFVSGCAVFDPFVDHNVNLDDKRAAGCNKQINGDDALKYACGVVGKLERYRSHITRTRAGMNTALFPIAGIIGYNAARDINSATNAALAAGGIAGYGVVTTLAQPDRVRIYNQGIDSVQCGIGVYRLAVAPAREGVSKSLFNARLAVAESNLANFRLQTDGDERATKEEDAKMLRASMFVATLKHAASTPPKNSRLQAQLTDLVNDTMSEMNKSLNDTIADVNGNLAAQLGNGAPGSGEGDEEEALSAMKVRLPSGFESEADTLLELFLQARADDEAAVANVDFSPCKYAGPSNVGVKQPVTQLMLGPDNSLNGSSQTALQGETFTAPIFGGQPPYHAAVEERPEGASAPEVKAVASTLTVVVPVDQPQGAYGVKVWDEAGLQSRKLTIEVKAKASSGR